MLHHANLYIRFLFPYRFIYNGLGSREDLDFIISLLAVYGFSHIPYQDTGLGRV